MIEEKDPLYNSSEDIIGRYYHTYWYCPYCLRYYRTKRSARAHEKRCGFRVTPIDDEHILMIDAEYYRLIEYSKRKKRICELIDNLAYISQRTQGCDFPMTDSKLVTSVYSGWINMEDRNIYQKLFIYIENQRPLGFLTVTFNDSLVKDGRVLITDWLVFEYRHREGIAKNLFNYMIARLSISVEDMVFDLIPIAKYTKAVLSYLQKYHKIEIVQTLRGRIKVNDWLKD